MKKGCWTILLVIIIILVLLVAVMALTKLCPPAGPWPMPPWCQAGETSFDISSIDELPDISQLPIFKETPQAEIELENAIVIPVEISAIPYPEFYNNPVRETAKVSNPFCAIVQEQVAYPADYLGSYEFPAIENAPLPEGIKRSIGIKDVWIEEPNLNDCPYTVPYELMRQSLDSTLERVKALGAEEITFSNYITFESFAEPVLQTPEQAAISESDLRYFAKQAEDMGFGMTLYLNLAPGAVKVEYEIQSGEWLSALINQWETFVLDQARIAEETGVDAMMINHFDYQPGIRGYEEIYQTEMMELLGKMREIYSGRILFMIEPVWGADLAILNEFLNSVDGFVYTPITAVLENAQDQTVSVENLKKLYIDNLRSIGRDFRAYDKTYLLRVMIQSEKDFLEKGWNEDMFCIAKGDDPCYQKNLRVDFSLQATAMEAILEAISEVKQAGTLNIDNIDIYGYWFTDVILPDFSQPQMAQSIRNKPAESIVLEWFKK